MKNRVALLFGFVIACGLLTTAQPRRAQGPPDVEFVVRFEGPILEAWKADLIAAGAEIVDYVPDFAFSVRMPRNEAGRIAALPGVASVTAVDPAGKLARGILRGGTRAYVVLLEREANRPVIEAAIASLGGQVARRDRDRLVVVAHDARLDAIAAIEGVRVIDNLVLYQKHNEFGGGIIVGADMAHAAGYDGSTQTIAVADTGLGNGTAAGAHPGLAPGRVSIFNWPGAPSACFSTVVDDGAVDVDSGHGTHVVTTAAGGGQPNGAGRGTAPGAGVIFQAVENYTQVSLLCTLLYGITDGYYLVGIPSDISDLFDQSYTAGARVQSLSWGSEASGGYTTASGDADQFVWTRRDMTITMSAGNSGVDGNGDGLVDAMSITSPATAKNVIAVGASENDRQSHWECDASLSYTSCAAQGGQNTLFTYGAGFPESYPANPLRDDPSGGDAQQMAAFSSRGPTADGRIKPDVVAPGTWMLSGYSDRYQQQYDPAPNPQNGAYQYDGWGFPYNGAYKYMGGTSMSAPLVGGGAAVVRDFYEKAHQHPASAALVKATLINSAVDLLDENNDGVRDNAFPIPNMHEGWGRIDLEKATGGSHAFVDETTLLTTSVRATFSASVTASTTPLKITVVWTDYAAAASAARALVNDLDLKVIAPDGTIYRGNAFAGGWSAAGGVPDRLNNVENVYVRSPAPGTWTVTVTGYNVPMGPQPFALVVDGAAGPIGAPDMGSAPAAVSVTASDATANEAGQGTGTFRFVRSGDTSMPLEVHYAVSGTATPDSDYSSLSGVAIVPAGASETLVNVIPVDDDLFEADETVVLTLASDAAYDLGDSSTATVVIVSNDSKPDLVVTAVTAPAAASPGETVTVTETTKNQGTGKAPASATGFYLSANTSFDATDTLLGSRAVASLAGSAISTASTSVVIPPTTAGGVYYLLAKADWENSVVETSDTNNVRASATVKIGPDLVVTAITAPASAASGATVVVADTTKNQGAGSAPASVTAFYLSANTFLDAGDERIGQRPVEPLQAGGQSTASTSITIPSTAIGGVYFILAVADGDSTVAEPSDSNNVKASATIRIGADLTVTSVTGPANAGAGSVIIMADTTTNSGAGGAPATATGFYLSTDSTLDTTDPLIGLRAVPALAAGAAHSGETPLTIPTNTVTGKYYIVAKADNGNSASENNENNNTRSRAVNVGPDLVVATVTMPAIGGAGKSMTVSDTMQNAGVDAIGATTAAVYLSANISLDAADTLLGVHPVGALPGETSVMTALPVVIPEATPTGSYYIIVQADRDNTALEFSETNNITRSGVVRIGPDLVESALSAPSSAVAGATVTVSDTVGNSGAGDAPPSATSFYLSTDSSIDGADILLGTRTAAAVPAAGSNAASTTLTLPAGLAARSYYLIAKADNAGQIAETAENNNTKFFIIRISVP